MEKSTAADLHAAIMNLPCGVPNHDGIPYDFDLAYRTGHRDARHAAAELAASHPAPQAAAEGVGSIDTPDEFRKWASRAAPERAAIPMTDANDICQVPPDGWYCTRKAGHDGPCAAHQDEPDRELDADDHACIAAGMDRIKAGAAIQPAGEAVRIVTSGITSAFDMDTNKMKLIFKSKAACDKFRSQLYASIFNDAPVQKDEKLGREVVAIMRDGPEGAWAELTSAGESLPEGTLCYTAQQADKAGQAGDDPIGELQAEARQAKLDDFVRSFRPHPAAPEGKTEASELPLTAQQVADGLVEDDPLTNASQIRLLNGDPVTINLPELTRIVNHFLAARPPVAAPDAAAIRSAAREEAARVCESLIRGETSDEEYHPGDAMTAGAKLDCAAAIRALSQPSPAVKSAAPNWNANEIDDLAFGYCPSGKIGELREFAAALLARPPRAVKSAEPTGWKRITAPGQVKVGDKLRFTIGDSAYRETVKQILDPGTDREELIYNKRMNYYVITKNAMTDFGSSKNVEFQSAEPTGGAA